MAVSGGQHHEDGRAAPPNQGARGPVRFSRALRLRGPEGHGREERRGPARARGGETGGRFFRAGLRAEGHPQGKASKEIPVREIMSTHVLYVRPQQTVEDCMALMTDKRVRHLPVMEEERLVGVISIGDVVKAIIAEQEFMIEQLQNYITGR